jgi:capsule polysaccharide modification protein KpsS
MISHHGGATVARAKTEAPKAFEALANLLRAELDQETLAALRLAVKNHPRPRDLRRWTAFHGAEIARDFRENRIVKVHGVHLSWTEAALVLKHTEDLE